ncbi:MAG: hypothetical protein QW570_08655 [Candidatus Caldarchaeum sp.]
MESIRVTRELSDEIAVLVEEIRALTDAVRTLADQIAWQNWARSRSGASEDTGVEV